MFQQFPKYSKRFKKIKTVKYKMNLRYIAYDILSDIGITDVTISKSCTFDEIFTLIERTVLLEDLFH